MFGSRLLITLWRKEVNINDIRGLNGDTWESNVIELYALVFSHRTKPSPARFPVAKHAVRRYPPVKA
jgi:hypothetical protein